MGPEDVARVQRILEHTARQLCNPDDLITVEGVKSGNLVTFFIEAEKPEQILGHHQEVVGALRHLVGEIGKKTGTATAIEVQNLAS